MLLIRTSECQTLDEETRSIAQIMGEQIRNRRIESGLSLEAVARVLSCEIAQLEAAESGAAKFTSTQIVELCPILRVVPSWFFHQPQLRGATQIVRRIWPVPTTFELAEVREGAA